MSRVKEQMMEEYERSIEMQMEYDFYVQAMEQMEYVLRAIEGEETTDMASTRSTSIIQHKDLSVANNRDYKRERSSK